MAVLTPVSDREAQALLGAYDLGTLVAIDGIAAGSVNSNFALRVAGQGGVRRVFLRVYEEQARAGAERETSMLERLARAGVPTPGPLRRSDGGFVSAVLAKPAALFPWCEGNIRCQAGVTPDDARRVGEALARVHIAGASEPAEPGRFRFEDLLGRLDRVEGSGHPRFAPLAGELRPVLDRVHRARDTSLPAGLTHGDLFRDNVLWSEDGAVAALLDFESACAGTYAYDLMVAILAWCVGDDIDTSLARAMCEGYEQVRMLRESERRALAVEGSFAALRFTITRITDYAMRTGAGPRVVKDWRRFMARFEKVDALGEAGLRRILGV